MRARGGCGFSVALIGADGAGKSTAAEALRASFGDHAICVYMGLHQEGRRMIRLPGLQLATSLAARVWRGLIGRAQQSRGKLVIFDRWSADALLEPVAPLGRTGRVRRWLLAHACPEPALIVLLDAPGEVLAARTDSHDPIASERQRQRYLALRQRLPHMVVLDASRSAPELRDDLIRLVRTGAAHER